MYKEVIQKALDELNGGNASFEEKKAYLKELQTGIDAMNIILDEVKAVQLQKNIQQ